jgi:uncharacterized protein DUF262
VALRLSRVSLETPSSRIDEHKTSLVRNPAHIPQDAQGGLCSYRTFTVEEIIEKSTTGEWNLPYFQRGFVWKAWQVCDIVDSLWRDYPIGPLLLWRNHSVNADSHASFWIADGQHRVAALCIAFARTPAWARDNGRRRSLSHFIVFDASTSPAKFRAVPNGAPPPPLTVPILDVLELGSDPESARGKVAEVAATLCANGSPLEPEDLLVALARLSRIGTRPVSAVLLDHEREEEIHRIFHRQIGAGMRFRRKLLRLIANGLARSRTEHQIV